MPGELSSSPSSTSLNVNDGDFHPKALTVNSHSPHHQQSLTHGHQACNVRHGTQLVTQAEVSREEIISAIFGDVGELINGKVVL